MRLIAVALLAMAPALLAQSPAPAVVGDDAPPTLAGATFLTSSGDQWKLRWHDEFSGDALDTGRWAIGLPWAGDDGEGRHHNDLYASYIADHNVVVSRGTLKLLTRREDVTAKNGRTFHFTEGLITTARSFRHTYGYWEARVKLPAAAGPGLWPAFWTLSEGWPPEMDICEIWTADNRSHQGLCYRPSEGGGGRQHRERWDEYNAYRPLPTDWTTYGMEWGPGYQIYNIDGRVMWRVYGDHVPDDRHYILLNSGVESGHPPTAATTFPNAFEVDYVRVYDRPEVPVIHNASFEEDDVRPWAVTGRTAQVGYDAHGGRRALRLDGGPSVAEQRVYGLRPATAYVVSAWVKPLTSDSVARLGVKDHGGPAVEIAFEGAARKAFRQLTLEFTTGPAAGGATVYLAVPDSAGAVLLDDLNIRPK